MERPPEIPQALRDEMAGMGPRWGQDIAGNIRLVTDRFTEILATAPKCADIRHGIPYGPHERQRLDLYLPPAANMAGSRTERRSVLAFVHGGAFVEGERDRTAEIHSNVLHYFSRFGIVGANIGYRLAPEARWPEGARDIGLALRLLSERAGGFALDPDRLFLMAHSAGAAHAASYAYDRRLHPEEGPGLAGLIVVSGRMRADNHPGNPNARRVEAYYGTDANLYDDMSPVTHVSAGSVPTFIAFAEWENPMIDAHCLELAWRLCAAQGRSPEVHRLKGHNHASIISHFNTAEDLLGRAVREFMGHPR